MDQRKPNLLMIIGLFYPAIGGAERECQKLSKKFQEQGCNVSVLTQYREGLPAHEIIDAIPVHRKIRGWHLFEITYMLSVAIFLFRHRRQFDVICCFGLYLFTAPAVLFSRIFGKKVFFRLECAGEFGDFKSISQLTLGNFILRCASWADGSIAISREIEQELVSNGFPARKIFRIPNCVDTSMFFPRGTLPNDSPPIISYIGRLSRQKGLDTLVKAVSLLQEKLTQFKVFIVGEGELKPILQEMVSGYGLNDKITFTGAISNVADYYQQSRIIVMPSYYEGLPLVLLEAMACGVPVVASPVGGILDVLGPPVNPQTAAGYAIAERGIFVEPGNADAVAAALYLLSTDQLLRERISQNALAQIKQCYTLDQVIKKYFELFISQPGAASAQGATQTP
jgi:glycosyltransferase involved in cell wall biosynthesis